MSFSLRNLSVSCPRWYKSWHWKFILDIATIQQRRRDVIKSFLKDLVIRFKTSSAVLVIRKETFSAPTFRTSCREESIKDVEMHLYPHSSAAVKRNNPTALKLWDVLSLLNWQQNTENQFKEAETHVGLRTGALTTSDWWCGPVGGFSFWFSSSDYFHREFVNILSWWTSGLVRLGHRAQIHRRGKANIWLNIPAAAVWHFKCLNLMHNNGDIKQTFVFMTAFSEFFCCAAEPASSSSIKESFRPGSRCSDAVDCLSAARWFIQPPPVM